MRTRKRARLSRRRTRRNSSRRTAGIAQRGRGKRAANVALDMGGYERLISLHKEQIDAIGKDNGIGRFTGLIPRIRQNPPMAILVYENGYATVGLDRLETDEYGDEYLSLASVGTLYK